MLKPHFAEAFCNLIHTLVFVCDWSNRDNDFARLSQVRKSSLIGTEWDKVQIWTTSSLSIFFFHSLSIPLSLSLSLNFSLYFSPSLSFTSLSLLLSLSAPLSVTTCARYRYSHFGSFSLDLSVYMLHFISTFLSLAHTTAAGHSDGIAEQQAFLSSFCPAVSRSYLPFLPQGNAGDFP